jgi:diguanylate cyclase (GGDEF)-like protein/PAS domain S-box-containing protein
LLWWNKWLARLWPLRQWLALRFALVAALPLVVVAALVWLVLLPRLRGEIEINHQALARTVARQAETYLLGAQRQLEAIVALRRDLGARPSPYWFGFLDAHINGGEVFAAIYLVDAADAVHSVGLSEPQRGQRNDLVGLDLSRREFLRQARARGAATWSETFLSTVTGRLAVALVIPFADQAIIGEISTAPLSSLINHLPKQTGLYALILDHRGQIIADSRHLLNDQQLSLSHLTIVSDAQRGQFATREFPFGDDVLIGTIVGIPHMDWRVLVMQPRHLAFQQLTSTLYIMGAGLGIALLLATGASWRMARAFSRRFDRYAEQARAVAGGDYQRPWPTFHITELADLSREMQDMANAMQQREQALIASEQRFRDFSSITSDWLWEQDDQFRFTFFSNSALLQTTYIQPASALGKTRWELPIELSPEQWAAHRAVLDAHQPFRELEYCVHDAAGEILWYRIGGQPIFDSAGRFSGYRGSGRDITERKRTEAALRESEERYRLLFERANDAIFVVERQSGRYLAANSAAERLTGRPMAELLTLGTLEVSPIHALERLNRLRQATETILFGEVDYQRPDGTHRTALLSVIPVSEFIIFGIAHDITDQKDAERRIEHLAYYDALTDLPNRVLLAQRADLALALAARHRAGLAVLFLDLDHFKNVNDSLGHAEGDALLIQVAARLRELTREADTVCRLGGDEFVVLLPDVDQEGALHVTDKLLAAFRQPFTVAGHTLRVTISVGIALYPHDGQNVNDLLKNADAALYQAKQDGRNARAFYAREMNVATLERLVLESELRKAIAAGQLRAYYQPKVRLSDGQPVGAEALVRWLHPDHGLIPPGRFIPLAEASDLIVELGDWMLREVCRQQVAWRRAGQPLLTVAVNLAARHFRDPGLPARIAGLLADHQLPPHALELELTESTLLESGPQTAENLLALERLGIELAIDDFGTGYSSLSYLKRLPLSALKIDQGFVRDLVNDPDDRILAATIVALGHSLGLRVVAEGVETDQQRRILLEQGCDLAQGYYFGRPVPAEDFVNWLSQKTDHP